MKNIQTGFFTMADSTFILENCSTLKSAQLHAAQCVEEFQKNHPGVDALNVAKALKMIDKSKSVLGVASGISYFVLAHTSEGLKVIK